MITSSIDLRKNVYDKNQYNKIFDTSFKEFGVLDNDSNEIPEVSVNTFFNLYDQLFYDIPAMGENNSHEYLVKTSGEYISQEFLAEEIQVLREEIAALRTENLQLETQLAQALGNEVDVQIPDIEIPDELVDINIPTPENPSVAIPSSTPSNLINTSGLKGKAKRIANAFNLTVTSNGKKGQNRLRRRLERSGYSSIQDFRQKLGV